MKVTVLSYTPEPEKVVASAARLCYSKTSAASIMDNFSEEKATSFINKLMDMGHMSPTEHVSFTFAIDGVSRTLLAQITRHRIASFSVQSLRYNNPFDKESTGQENSLSLESICYLEGLVLSLKLNQLKSSSYQDYIEKYNITGKNPDKIPHVNMAAYLRGVFDGVGILTEDLDTPTIEFPLSLEHILKASSFNTTQKDNKLLIQKDDSFNFPLYIYKNLDFARDLYDKKKLLLLCDKSNAFREKFFSRATDFIDTVYYSTVPESISKKPEAILTYINGLDECKKTYLKLVQMGVRQEDARNILPMGTQTRMVMTMNVRSLYNFFNLRCCQRAQSEIRELANLMLLEVRKIAPGLFKQAGAPCEATGFCPEGDYGCGRYPAK